MTPMSPLPLLTAVVGCVRLHTCANVGMLEPARCGTLREGVCGGLFRSDLVCPGLIVSHDIVTCGSWMSVSRGGAIRLL